MSRPPIPWSAADLLDVARAVEALDALSFQLAERLGISRQAITALEREPDAATFERWMRVWAELGLAVSLQPDFRVASPPMLEW